MDSECYRGQVEGRETVEGWETVSGCFKVSLAGGESGVWFKDVVMLVGQKERACIL